MMLTANLSQFTKQAILLGTYVQSATGLGTVSRLTRLHVTSVAAIHRYKAFCRGPAGQVCRKDDVQDGTIGLEVARRAPHPVLNP